MEISEQELRAMIRDAIARHAGSGPSVDAGGGSRAAMVPPTHASHGMLLIAASSDGDCIIEPAVRCNHCGYCKSLGH